MDTYYINVAHTELRDRHVKAELRVEPSEGWPGQLDLGIYGYSSGNQLILPTLDRDQVEQLRAACEAFLTEVTGD